MSFYDEWQKEWKGASKKFFADPANKAKKLTPEKHWYLVPNPHGAHHYPPGFLKTGLRASVIELARPWSVQGQSSQFLWVKLGTYTQHKNLYAAYYDNSGNRKSNVTLEQQLEAIKKNVGTLDMLILDAHAPYAAEEYDKVEGRRMKKTPPYAGARFGGPAPEPGKEAPKNQQFDHRMPDKIADLIKEIIPNGILVIHSCGGGNNTISLLRISKRIGRPVTAAINYTW